MDQNKINEILNQIFLEVLEQYAFLFPEPLSESINPQQPFFSENKYLRAEMSAQGLLTGIFVMLLPLRLCGEVEENLTGIPVDSELNAESGVDGAKEILNIITANVMTALLGHEVNYQISIPTCEVFVASDWARLSQLPYSSSWMAEEFPVFLFFDGVENKVEVKRRDP